MATRKLSVHQLPKSRGYLECWVPHAGCAWVDMDIAALEQVVLAELSEDPAMMKLYGPNAKPFQDIYLFNGAHYAGLRDPIRALYDPESPPKSAEELEHVKHALKGPRSRAKKASLGFSYGMGWAKLQREFRLIGVEFSDEQAQALVASHRLLYAGVQRWADKLDREWLDRGGWVYNGIARPVAVAADCRKDLVNRVVQSTGHDLVMMLIYRISKMIDSQRFPAWPVIVDFHDQTTWECAEVDASDLVAIYQAALAALNRELSGVIPLRADIRIIHSLAESKCE